MRGSKGMTQDRGKCLCRACGQAFGSLYAFDRHRVGVHGERRCQPQLLLSEQGWQKDRHGRWRTPGRKAA